MKNFIIKLKKIYSLIDKLEVMEKNIDYIDHKFTHNMKILEEKNRQHYLYTNKEIDSVPFSWEYALFRENT